MNKKTLLILLISLFINFGFSQITLSEFEGQVKWSELLQNTKFRSAAQFIGQDGDFVYVFQGSGAKRLVEKYDIKTLTLTGSSEFILKYNDKKILPLDGFMYDNKPAILSSYYDRSSNYYKSIVHFIDPTSLKPSKPYVVNQSKEMAEINYSGLVRGQDLDVLQNDFLISENKEFVLTQEIMYSTQSKFVGRKKIKGIRGRLFDKDLKLIVKANYKFPHEIFTLIQTKVGNTGLVYAAGHPTHIERDLEGIMKGETEVYDGIEIYAIDLVTGTINSIKIETGDREVTGFQFCVNSDGSVIVSGLTAPKNKGVSGSFFAKYDNELKEVVLNFQDFESDFISHVWTEKLEDKVDKINEKNEEKGKEAFTPDFYKYKFKNLIQKPNGTTTLFAEQWHVKVITSSSSSKSTSTYFYYFNDIVALNFDQSGELLWKTVIDKSQISINDMGFYSSFCAIRDGNDISILFNGVEDKKAQNGVKLLAKEMVLKNNVIGVHLLLDADGNQRAEKLYEFESGDLKMVPHFCESINENELFLYANSNNGFKIGKFTK